MLPFFSSAITGMASRVTQPSLDCDIGLVKSRCYPFRDAPLGAACIFFIVCSDISQIPGNLQGAALASGEKLYVYYPVRSGVLPERRLGFSAFDSHHSRNIGANLRSRLI